MARTGRPRKPTAQKLMDGTYRKDRDYSSSHVGQEVTAIPDPPERFNREEKAMWYRTCSELIVCDILTTLDLVMLEILVVMIVEFQKLNSWIKDVTKDDLKGYSKDELYKYNFIKRQVSSLRTDIKAYAGDFGMTPQARRSLLVKPKDDNVDPFLELIG